MKCLRFSVSLLLWADLFCLEMEAAVAALNGRFFGGRHVLAQAYDQALFDANDLSG